MYRLRKKNVENMPSEMENATALPAEKAGILKNESGIIGCGERDSHTSRPTIRTAPPISVATMIGSLQPFWLASIKAYVRLNRPAVPSKSPGMSS